jgi:hypothetical protein
MRADPVVTRSMSSSLARTTTTVLNALTTPGIVTRIVEHLPPNDKKGLGALFLLVNQPHVRHELEPCIVSFREKYRRDEIRRQIREYMGRIKSMKSWEWDDRHQFNRDKAERILGVYAYMGTVTDHLHLLGKRLAIDIDANIHSLLHQYNKPWFTRRLEAEREKLRDYIEWGHNSLNDPNVPWYG